MASNTKQEFLLLTFTSDFMVQIPNKRPFEPICGRPWWREAVRDLVCIRPSFWLDKKAFFLYLQRERKIYTQTILRPLKCLQKKESSSALYWPYFKALICSEILWFLRKLLSSRFFWNFMSPNWPITLWPGHWLLLLWKLLYFSSYI